MNLYIPLACLAFWCWLPRVDAQDPATAPPPPASPLNAPAGEILVSKIKAGTFVEFSDPAEVTALKEVLVGLTVKTLPVVEAQVTWANDDSIREMARTLATEHYLIGLRDTRGKVFFKTVTGLPLPAAAIKTIQDSLVKQESVVKLLNEAETKIGTARMELLVGAASTMGTAHFKSVYPDLTQEIKKSEGVVGKEVRDQLIALDKGDIRMNEINRLHFDLTMILRNLPTGASIEEQIAKIDAFITERKLEGDYKQVLTMRKYLTYNSAGRYQEALNALEEARLILPNSQMATKIGGFKERIKERMEKSPTPPPSPPKPIEPQNPGTPPP